MVVPLAVTALTLGRALLVVAALLVITIIIASIIAVASTIITSIIIVTSTTIIITSVIISTIIFTAVLILITTVKPNFLLYINAAAAICREVTRFTAANISAGLYTVLENIKLNNIEYLNIGFNYSVEIYSVTTLINGRLGGSNTTTANSGDRSRSNRITGTKIIFNELIIIFESFSKIANGFKLFNKNVILKLRVLNTESIIDMRGNLRIQVVNFKAIVKFNLRNEIYKGLLELFLLYIFSYFKIFNIIANLNDNILIIIEGIKFGKISYSVYLFIKEAATTFKKFIFESFESKA